MNDDAVLAIVGPTASGKTALALKLARERKGEIICADSRTVYQGMDVGTAKPTPEEQKLVAHHLLDVVAPNERFSVADFKYLAKQAINDIYSRGRLPILVGGTGLYVDAVIYDFALRPVATKEEKVKLSALSDNQLRQRVEDMGLKLNASDLANRRRLERAASAGQAPQQARDLAKHIRIIGLNPTMQELEGRIAERTKLWFEKNILEETDALVTTFGAIESLNTTPYKEVAEYLANGGDLLQCQALINLHLRQLAKRQLTWFKRNPDIRWASSPEEAAKLLV